MGKLVKVGKKGLSKEVSNAMSQKSSKDVAKALKSAKFSTDEVGDALKDSFKLSEKAMADALKGGGFAAKEVDKFTQKTFKSVGKSVKKTGKKIKKALKL